MYPFAFQKQVTFEENRETIDTPTLLMKVMMLIIQNERLIKIVGNNQQLQSRGDISFNINDSQFGENHQRQNDQRKEEEQKLELELKQLKIDNLTELVKNIQQQLMKSQQSNQDWIRKYTSLETNSRQQINESKAQLNHYKSKYQREAISSKQLTKIQYEYKLLQMENQSKCKENQSLTAQLKCQLTQIKKQKQVIVMENQKKMKQMRDNIDQLKKEINQKAEQCYQLKITVNDAPKLQELNRWINKVKQYEERQMQAMSKISQMSQQNCILREKYRKTQHQYKQLQKIKNKLENTVTENKESEDSMTIYFDRLTTYEKIIKDYQCQIKSSQNYNKTIQNQYQEQVYKYFRKIKTIQQQRDNAINQWQTIAEEMNKQKNIMASMQGEIDDYYKKITAQKNQIVEQSREMNQESKISTNRIQPLSMMVNSKLCQKQNRSFSVNDQRNSYQSYIEMDHQLDRLPSYDITSRLQRPLLVGRASSQQQLAYQSSRLRNNSQRINTQSSLNTSNRDMQCEECESRVHQYSLDKHNRSNSLNRCEQYLLKGNLYNDRDSTVLRPSRAEQLNNRLQNVNDQKKLLMEKLNIMKPNDSTFRAPDKNISSLYGKNYRQMNNSCQSILKINQNINAKLNNSNRISSTNRLQISKSKNMEEKQNLNDMIIKRYVHLLGKN